MGLSALCPCTPGLHPGRMGRDRNGLAVLGRDECLALLRHSDLGRVAVSVGALPAVFPVNYRMLGDDVVFRTGTGSKLHAAVTNAIVAFEVDAVDREHRAGWSVLVTGTASELLDPREIANADGLGLEPWLQGPLSRWVRVRTQMLSGRRLERRLVPDVPVETRRMVADPQSFGSRWAPLAECPTCGSDALVVVTDGETTNSVCTSCGRCWHVALGHVNQVDTRTCPGCSYRPLCRARAAMESAGG